MIVEEKTRSRSTDGAPGEEASRDLLREADARSLGHVGGKSKALDAATRADMRVFASKHPHLTVKSVDLLALLDATEPTDG